MEYIPFPIVYYGGSSCFFNFPLECRISGKFKGEGGKAIRTIKWTDKTIDFIYD